MTEIPRLGQAADYFFQLGSEGDCQSRAHCLATHACRPTALLDWLGALDWLSAPSVQLSMFIDVQTFGIDLCWTSPQASHSSSVYFDYIFRWFPADPEKDLIDKITHL